MLPVDAVEVATVVMATSARDDGGGSQQTNMDEFAALQPSIGHKIKVIKVMRAASERGEA